MSVEKEGEIFRPEQEELQTETEPELEEENTAEQEMGRRKIEFDPQMTEKEFKEKFPYLHRATYYRAKERGYFWVGYHNRLMDIDPQWAEQHTKEIEDFARSGAWKAIKMLSQKTPSLTTEEFLSPFEVEDVIATARLRLLELSGHDRRENKVWRYKVAFYAGVDFIRTEIISEEKHKDKREETRERYEEGDL